LFVLRPDEMSLVATDGHRLALVTVARDPATSTQSEEVRAILPKKTLGELGRLLVDGEEDISYERGENHLFFNVGGRMLISRMIDGQFPAYERVIPKGNDKHIEFERDRLTSAVKRVALLSNERSRAVKFQIDKGKVDVTSSSPELGEAHEMLPVEYGGEAMQICFNAQYVLDFLAAVTTDVVSLGLKDEVSQAVMRPVGAEGYDYTYVIMPMRV
jgi:DNA polymerase-3 subunit beta